MTDTLLDLAQKSSENDLAFLIRAKEESKRRMKDNPDQNTISAFKKAKLAVAEEAQRLQGRGGSMRVFKTQLDATSFLQDSGFKVSKSQFNRDVTARKISKNTDGHFEESALLGYAAVNLDPAAQQENRALSDATVGRIEADADLKRYSAERLKLKLAKEQGLLMHRADHEENLAARALFFKSEIESFGYRKAGEIIALVHGDDSRLQELLTWWADATADWMDAWAADHEFTAGDADNADDIADDNAGGIAASSGQAAQPEPTEAD